MSDQRRSLRIFLSSPGDVPAERKIALEVIEQLQYEAPFRDHVTFEVVAWDKPGAGTPMLASKTPQAAIDEGLPTPGTCDIVIVILWSRMGTPLPFPDYQKPSGEPYYSGTEWEFENAMQANRQHQRPEVVVYRRTEKVLLDADSQNFEAALEQVKRVRNFFAQFVDAKTGAILRGYNAYEKPEDFRREFTTHLRRLAEKLMKSAKPASTPVPRADWPGSPFPGLRAFTDRDAPIFFGRGRETDELIEHIRRNRFAAVVGASGSGKSSLVWAGVIPRLAANAISSEQTASKDWLWLRFTPGGTGDNPFTAFATALQPFLPNQSTAEIAEMLANNPASVGELVPRVLSGRPAWAELLLFIDQLEELVTLVDPVYRAPIAEMIAHAVAGGRVRAVATLRADFLATLIPVGGALVRLLQTGAYPLGTPDPVALHEMIIRPAERAGLQFEGELARRILNETGDDPGALALMAYLLDELYQRRSATGQLTVQAYNALGGVAGAIGQRAEATFTQLKLTAPDQTLQRLFYALIEVDDRGTATRRRVPLAEVTADPDVARLVNVFVQARLLITDAEGDDSTGGTLEVAHEALLRNWKRLANWIESAADDRRLLRRIERDAEEWDRKGRPDFMRPPAEELAELQAACKRLHVTLTNPLLLEFVEPEQVRILQALRNPDLGHLQRREIGERLCVIGDTRPGVGLRADGLPDIEWCKVDLGGKSSAEVDIEKIGSVKVDLPFAIARYPITYAQFQGFVDAPDGFGNRARDWYGGLAADDSHKRQLEEQHFRLANHPRENVSWYDAIAFCRWLSWRLGELGDIRDPLTWAVRLPVEAEWQFAASRTDRAYPWGNEWDGRLANTTESGLGRSVAVGMYPGGAASCGALDMSGNIREWTLTEVNSGRSDALADNLPRVLRGGSWGRNRSHARITYRPSEYPGYRDNLIGFRLVTRFPE